MATLNLFPARIRFTNLDGTLTPEAYRALQIVFDRVGGALGDTGTDSFGADFAAATDNPSSSDMVIQTGTPDAVTSGASITKGTATIDFGAFPGRNEALVVVGGQASITVASVVICFVMSDDTSVDHTASDHKYLPEFASFTSGTPVAATGFTIYARSIHKLTGKYTLRWVWSN